MERTFCWTFVLLLLMNIRCKQNQRNTEPETKASAPGFLFKSNLMPQLAQTDTAYVLYYNQPGDHRQYKQTVIKTGVLQPLVEDANASVTSGKAQCSTEGKIHFYGKGEAAYTVYFSKADSCRMLSFIINGEKYSTAMSAKTEKILDSLERFVRKVR